MESPNDGHRRRPIAAAGLGLFLTGCSLFGSDVQPPCPRLAIVNDAASITQFRDGPGRDLTDVRYEGYIVGVSQTCEYDSDGFVDVTVAVNMVLTRGPAAEDETGSFVYFVALTNPEGKIVTKETLPVTVTFPSGAKRLRLRDEVSEHIVFAPAPDAHAWRSFVGFQLTPEQLKYRRGQE